MMPLLPRLDTFGLYQAGEALTVGGALRVRKDSVWGRFGTRGVTYQGFEGAVKWTILR